MKVSPTELKQIFNDLIQENKPREEIASWASIRQSANDAEDLEFKLPSEKKKMWTTITYLMGVYLKDIDGSYLHSIENFKEFREKFDI